MENKAQLVELVSFLNASRKKLATGWNWWGQADIVLVKIGFTPLPACSLINWHHVSPHVYMCRIFGCFVQTGRALSRISQSFQGEQGGQIRFIIEF